MKTILALLATFFAALGRVGNDPLATVHLMHKILLITAVIVISLFCCHEVAEAVRVLSL